MAFSLPTLRNTELNTGGTTTLTIPAGKTYIIKCVNVRAIASSGDYTGNVTATINSNIFQWFSWNWSKTIFDTPSNSIAFEMDGMSQNVIGSTIVMKTGDTITVQATTGTTYADIGYYILEDDF